MYETPRSYRFAGHADCLPVPAHENSGVHTYQGDLVAFADDFLNCYGILLEGFPRIQIAYGNRDLVVSSQPKGAATCLISGHPAPFSSGNND
jgi:hypothetical protein